MIIPLVQPDWPTPPNVKSIITCAQPDDTPYGTANLGLHVGDQAERVLGNREQLALQTGVPRWQWLNQVHGVNVIEATKTTLADQSPLGPKADACFTRTPNLACAVLTADCLPVLLCDTQGEYVAAVHAGWRGLAAGILAKTVSQLSQQKPGTSWIAYIGPAIGQPAFEVGSEVKRAFLAASDFFEGDTASAFIQGAHTKWLAGLTTLARMQLRKSGLRRDAIFAINDDSPVCTFTDSRFNSYRRQPITGRFASAIWLEPS